MASLSGLVVTIPLYEQLDIKDEVEFALKDIMIVIRPVREYPGNDYFADLILADLIQQGFQGNELLAKFREKQRAVRGAVQHFITESGKVARFFKKLVEKPLKKAFFQAIEAIQSDPSIGQPKTGDLRGLYGYDVFYQGVNYEIAYRVEENEDGELIVVILAGSRENFYEELKRYSK